MAKFPTYEEMAKDVVEIALDFEYQGKTIREWIEIIAEQEPCKDAISRQAALNAVTMAEVRWQAVDNISKLPSVNPEATVKEFVDKCRECGAKYGRLLKERSNKP